MDRVLIFRSHPRKQPFLWTTKSRQQNWNLAISLDEFLQLVNQFWKV